MPGLKEYGYTWTLTTGSTAGAWIDTGWATEHSFLIESSTGASDGGAITIETRIPNSTVLILVGSTLSVGNSSRVSMYITGVFPEIRARVTASTGTVIVYGSGAS